ncbi:MAG: hypothetical protein JEZ05_06745 [Tenericutes bacterium]|nr:hypothetical protein [Mycoplasmatota bacterium]
MLKKTLFISCIIMLTFLSGCQISKYDSNDAEKYAENNLNIDVKSIFCTGYVGFDGSSRYNLENDEREVCFILGKDQDIEYVYSYGSKNNTKLINDEPSISSSDLFNYLDEIDIDISYWKFVYVGEVDTLVYQITTIDSKEFLIFSEQSVYKYYVYTPDDGLIEINYQELIEHVFVEE